MFDPDPNKKSKRPPPLPSFASSKNQQPKKDNQLDKKLDSFFAQISKQIVVNRQHQAPIKQGQNKQQQKAQTTQAATQLIQQPQLQTAPVDKKKISLASINSKLNNMLSTKKINLNTIQAKSADTQKPFPALNPQKVQKKRNQLPGEYDPNIPNNYDLTKNFWAQKLAQLQRQSDEQDFKAPKVVNKNGLGMQKLTEEIRSQQQIQQPIEQEEVLEEKQQVALRMMQKFGYKVGTGLGKQSQGITTPLTIKKTTDTSCIIQQSSINMSQIIRPEISAKNALLANNVTTTEVIVFINLIKMQDFTETVEKELKEECQTYGLVKNLMVFLLKDNQDKQELRIFVEFERKDEAFAAFCKINNRYYRQNLASIRFYPKEAFESYKLNLPTHGHIQT